MIKKIIYLIYNRLMMLGDRILGVDFQTKVSSNNPEYAPYAPTPSYLLVPLYRYLRKNVKNGGIIDIGCGKGKMLRFFQNYHSIMLTD